MVVTALMIRLAEEEMLLSQMLFKCSFDLFGRGSGGVSGERFAFKESCTVER